MGKSNKSKLIKLEIIKMATHLFLKVGYSKTSPQMIAKDQQVTLLTIIPQRNIFLMCLRKFSVNFR